MPSVPETPLCLLCGRRTVLLYRSNVPNGAPIESSELACTSPPLSVHDDIFTCHRCGLARAEPPGGVAEIEESYRDVHDNLYRASEPERREDFQRAIEGIERHPFVSPGSLLEIGSSVGLFLDEATKRGGQRKSTIARRPFGGCAATRRSTEWIQTKLPYGVPQPVGIWFPCSDRLVA